MAIEHAQLHQLESGIITSAESGSLVWRPGCYIEHLGLILEFYVLLLAAIGCTRCVGSTRTSLEALWATTLWVELMKLALELEPANVF